MRQWVNNRLVGLGIICLALVGGQTGSVHARPAICVKLEKQLASAATASGNSKYARAAVAQSQQLQIARGQARAAGCNGGLFASGSRSQACGKLKSTISRMEANLANLKAKSGGITPATARQRILASMAANGCNKRDQLVQEVSIERKAAERPKSDSLITLLFGGNRVERRLPDPVKVVVEKPASRKVRVMQGSEAGIEYEVGIGAGLYGAGSYRTVCVRTCDGYYFPVSYSSSTSKFSLDEKLCQQMCPGSKTELYFHRVPDQEPEEMISLKREPYAALPTAFKYRRDGMNSVEGCTCKAQSGTMPLTTPANAKGIVGVTEDPESEAGAMLKPQKWVPYPTSKPAALQDEEMRLNAAGDMDAAALRYLINSTTDGQTLASQGDVRVVGPAFFPDQVQAEAAPVPAPTNVR